MAPNAAPERAIGIVGFSAAGVAAQVVQMGCALVVLRWVPPAQMGVWLALQVAEACALVLRLGVMNAMNREFPFLLGQGRRDEALRHVQTAGAYLAACATVVGVGFAGWAWLTSERESGWQMALWAYSMYAAAGIWRGFLESTFRGGQEFRRLAQVQLVGAALHVVTLPLVVFAGFSGFCGRAALLAVVTTGICHWLRPVRMAFAVDFGILRKLVWEGLPLFASNYLASIAGQFPRVILLWAGGAALLGLFAPIAALLAVGALLPGVLLSYLLPKQNFEFGRGGDADAMAGQAWRQALLLSAALIPVGGAGFFVLRSAVSAWLPDYVPALPALGYAAAIVVFSPLRLATSVFSTLKAWRPMLTHVAIGFVLAGALPWLMWRLDSADVLVAIMRGTLLATVLHALAAWPCIRWAVRYGTRQGASGEGVEP